jgi:Co/Zn/Cd efflux system component
LFSTSAVELPSRARKENVPAQATVKLAPFRNERELQDARFAMRISLIVGLVMLAGKVTAYWMTHSAAILSDAAESVVHVIAVAFAAFSLRLSAKPSV